MGKDMRPTLEIRKLRRQQVTPLEKLKGIVMKFDGATDPIADGEWENA